MVPGDDVDDVSNKVLSLHNGPLLLALGVAGVACTTTFTVPAGETQPFSVAVTLYVPPPAMVTPEILGFCMLLVNPFGPVHVYVMLPVEVVLAWRLRLLPLQTGPLVVATGVTGGLGSLSVNGPTTFDMHPVRITFTPE